MHSITAPHVILDFFVGRFYVIHIVYDVSYSVNTPACHTTHTHIIEINLLALGKFCLPDIDFEMTATMLYE